MPAPSSGRMANCVRLAACACLLALAFNAAAQAGAGNHETDLRTESRTWSFDIPAQDLKSALQHWSEITGVDWAHVGAEFGGVRTRGVSGKATAAEALRQLLSGTGYVYSILPSGSVCIVRAKTGNSAQGAETAA